MSSSSSLPTSTTIDEIFYKANDFYCKFDVYLGTSSDYCVLVFPNVSSNTTVTIDSAMVGTTGSYVPFEVTINQNTLTVWKQGASTNIAEASSDTIGQLTQLMIQTTDACQVRVLLCGGYWLSPQQRQANTNTIIIVNVVVWTVVLVLFFGFLFYFLYLSNKCNELCAGTQTPQVK